MSRPLEGIRILEWGVLVAVPSAGMLLARLGAEVIKIENTEGGDPIRGTKYMWGNDMTAPDGRSLFFESFNLNKKSIAVNLKTQEGREIFFELAEKVDVVITNVRLSAQRRLGLSYESLKERNPRLVYVHISGYGNRGDEADRPGIDFCVQGRTGLLRAMKGPEDEPNYVAGVGDQMGAASALAGVLFGLFARERLGEGVAVEGSLLAGLTWLQGNYVAPLLLGAKARKPVYRKSALNPLHNTYRTADDGWLALSLGTETDRHWPSFCEALGLQHLRDDARFVSLQRREENHLELISILGELFARYPAKEIVKRLSEYDLMAEVIQTPAEFADDAQALAAGCMEPYDHPTIGPVKVLGVPFTVEGTELAAPLPGPELGQDTPHVLAELLGYSEEKLASLWESGAIF